MDCSWVAQDGKSLEKVLPLLQLLPFQFGIDATSTVLACFTAHSWIADLDIFSQLPYLRSPERTGLRDSQPHTSKDETRTPDKLRAAELLSTALHCDPTAHAVPHKHYREFQHAGCLSTQLQASAKGAAQSACLQGGAHVGCQLLRGEILGVSQGRLTVASRKDP